jgi:hypothetical protein
MATIRRMSPRDDLQDFESLTERVLVVSELCCGDFSANHIVSSPLKNLCFRTGPALGRTLPPLLCSALPCPALPCSVPALLCSALPTDGAF